MTDSGRPAPRRAYWRCRECGTPNPSRPYLTHCLGCDAVSPMLADPEPPRREGSPPPPPKPVRARVRRGLGWASYGYAALILIGLAAIRWVGDGWWGVVILLFLPRWMFLVPIVALGAASVWARRPKLWTVQGATALVIVGPLMGFSLPIPPLWGPKVDGDRFRIMTFNRGLGRIDSRRLIDMIERERVDLICFQEGRPDDPALDAYFSRNWYRDRTKSLASRYPIVHEFGPLPEKWASEDRYTAKMLRVRLRAPSGAEFLLASVHLPTLRWGLTRFLGRDLTGFALHIDWWRHELDRVVAPLLEARGVPVLAGGDFNMPPDDSTMVALRSVFRFGFEEAGWGFGYTRPSRFPWFRIDHILATPQWRITRCWVGPDFGSDHLPLLAEVVLPTEAE
jgi:vancomycin resistance protein VanJ